MGPEKNRELLDYYRDRHVMLLEPDRNLRNLSTYPANLPQMPESTRPAGAR
jgi:hypothetical protein